MENTELIEKYATGKLEGPEKDAFEQRLKTDTSLQSDLVLQRQIIDVIKAARVNTLKTMLNQVPVGGIMSTGLSAAKIVTGAVAAGVIVTSSILYFRSSQPEPAAPTTENELSSTEKTPKTEIIPQAKEEKPAPVSEPARETKKSTASAKKHTAVHPKIDVVDPTSELTKDQSLHQEKLAVPQSVIVTSRIGVDINSSSSKYSFHYQFNQGKLILYGIFDSGLYEILEVNGDTHSIFLYYKDNYYLLNEKQSAITPLTAIKDPELVKKLKEYRGR